MKVMFIVQGEGRGHLTQAITLAESLRAGGHEVTEVLVGRSASRRLPSFFEERIAAPVRRFESPNFLPTARNKRSHVARSVAYNVCRLHRYAASIMLLRRRIAASGADIVVNFYEPLTGLAYLCCPPDVPQVSIGHQYLFLHSDFRLPPHSRLRMLPLLLFTYITGIGAAERLALSFRSMDDDCSRRIRVMPPLLRGDVLRCRSRRGDYVHGYMVNAGFCESVLRWHNDHTAVPLRFFWDRKGAAAVERVDATLSFYYIDDKRFLESLAGCRAYATTAGFESVCEAMYLGKPVLMVPAHVEQDCNAYDAARCGAGIVDSDFRLDRLVAFAETYERNDAFAAWARLGAVRITTAIERIADMPRGNYGVLRPAILRMKHTMRQRAYSPKSLRHIALSLKQRLT